MIAVCVNAIGMSHVLTEGWEYEVESLPLGAVRVWIEDWSEDAKSVTERPIVCCGDRFEIVTL